MLVYYITYIFIASLALFGKNKSSKVIYGALFFILLIFLIGFRYQVGGDWYSYLDHYNTLENIPFKNIFQYGFDPGHAIVNWIMGKYKLSIYGVNFIYALIFTIGLFIFSMQQPNPFLALAVAFPYLVLVVAMGYSRQSVAIGFFMIALTNMQKQNFWKYVFWVFMAALFHKTALVLLPFALFIKKEKKSWWLYVIILVPAFYGGWNMFIEPHLEHLVNIYVGRHKESSGALIRVLMNSIPAILFIINRKKMKRIYSVDYKFWLLISIVSISVLFFLSISSTVVDRLSLYLIPLQLLVYSRLPIVYRNKISPKIIKILIIGFYGIVLFVWLNFASHANTWIPYQNIIFKDII